MAVLASSVFFDTPVFIAGLAHVGPATPAARRVLDAVADGRVARSLTAWHCCLEFYAVTTRLPGEWRLSPAAAVHLLQHNILGRFRILQMPDPSFRSFFADAATEPVFGARIYDNHIAEVARQAGAKVVVTENPRDFAALTRHGIRVMSAAEFAAEARL